MHRTPQQSDAWNFVSQSQAAEWFDGLPVGNGDLGALVLSSQFQTRIPLAKSDLWHTDCDDGTGRARSFYPFKKFSELRALIENGKWDEIDHRFHETRRKWTGHFALRSAGTLVLDTSRFEKEIELLDFRRHLDMRAGTAHGVFQTRVRRQTIDALASADFEVLALRVRCDLNWRKGNPPRKMNFGMDISLEQLAAPCDVKITTQYRNKVLCQVVRDATDTHAIALSVKGRGIRIARGCDDRGITITGNRSVDFTITLALTRGSDAARQAVSRAKRARAAGFETIRRRHRSGWRRFWNASSVSIPDQRMLRQYHFGLYLLASSSRRGFQMPGLQGLWYTRAPGTKWNEYTNDLNIQMNYWPVYASNHLELAWPYYDTVRNWLPEARRYTRDYWQCNGVQFSCCASPTGIVPPGYLTTMHWAGCAAFVAQNFWTHFLYSRDEKFLRDVTYPILKECAEFYVDFLKLDSRGLYEIWPSNNPEAGEGSHEAWGRNVTMDIALLRMLFGAVVRSARVLKIDSEFAHACQQRLDRLPRYPMRNGAMIDMEDKEFLYSHRHNGIITPIYPCDDIAGPVAKRTIERFMKRGKWLWGCHTVPWQAAAYARIGRGDAARGLLNELFDSYFLPDGGFNLNYNYQRRIGGIIGPAVFCNESNSGFSAALLEMLLQSHRGIIQVFPAVPDDWRDIEFRELLAQGAFHVSARRVQGRTTDMTIHSERGGRVQVASPWPRADLYQGRKKMDLSDRRGILEWVAQPKFAYSLKPSNPVR